MTLPKLSYPIHSIHLPSNGKEIKFRPFIVQEEKLLLAAKMGNDPKELVNALKQVASNCVVVPEKFDIDDICLFDLEFLFMNLRSKSISNVVDIRFFGRDTSECDECKKVKIVKVNLDDVKVTTTEGHTNKIEIDNNIGIVMRYPKFGEQTTTELANNIKNPKDLIKAITDKIVGCIDYIYDEKAVHNAKDYSKEELVDFIDKLPREALNKVEKFFDTAPSIRHVLDLTCKKCGHKEEYILEGLSSFFV